MERRMQLASVFIPLFVLSGASAGGCSSQAGARNHNHVAHQNLVYELRKKCIEWAGGQRMDAVDLYGGEMTLRCSQWAYRQAREIIK